MLETLSFEALAHYTRGMTTMFFILWTVNIYRHRLKRLQSLNYIHMKHFFLWAFVVLSLCAGFTSCSDDDDEVIPELIVNTPTLSVAGTGGTFEVPILTSGLAIDETVVITADVDWVSHLQATGDHFSFEVSKAPLDVESRTATFTLSLSQHADIKATCTLTQGKNHENYYIRMDELRGTSALYTVIPSTSQSEGRFISYCFRSDELAQYGSATEVKDAIWEKQVAKAKEIKQLYHLYISTTLGWRSRSGSESTQELVRDLEPGKEYTIVAFGYTGDEYGTAEEMKVTTDLVKYTFVTPDEVPEVIPTTLDVKVNVRGALYDVDITAGSSDAYIYPFIEWKAAFDNSYPTDEVFISHCLSYYYSGASYEDIFELLHKSRYQATSGDISNNTEAIACAAAFDSHLNLLCQPTQTTFTVGEPQPSDNVLTIDITELEARSIGFKVNGSNSDPFRVIMMEVDAMEYIMSNGGTEEEKEALLAEYLIENGAKGQDGYSTNYGTWPTADFVILAVGVAGCYDEEVATTRIFKQYVTTPEATLSTATCAFDIVKCFNSMEFAHVFGYTGEERERTTAFTFTCSEDADSIFYYYADLGDFLETQSAFEENGISSRFSDWQYMQLEVGKPFKKLGTISSWEEDDLMIFAAAKDKDGNFGPIAHFRMECAKMPVSPISEISAFNPNNGGAAPRSVQVPLRADASNPQQPEKLSAGRKIGMKKCYRLQ